MRFFLFPFLIYLTKLGAADYFVNGEWIDDNRAAELVTVITSTSPIPSMPSLTHIYPSQSSLQRLPALAKCKKIIVFDGISPKFTKRKKDYDTYKNNIIKLTKTDPAFYNTKLIYCKNWGHLSGSIREAIKSVTTPFVFLFQHDHVLEKEFDLNGCIATMLVNPKIKYIHFPRSKFTTNTTPWFGTRDTQIPGISFVPLERGFGWVDHSHLSTVDYYSNFVLPQCGRNFMEVFLNKNFHTELQNCKDDTERDRIHEKYGVYLYAPFDGPYFFHTDGRKT